MEAGWSIRRGFCRNVFHERRRRVHYATRDANTLTAGASLQLAGNRKRHRQKITRNSNEAYRALAKGSSYWAQAHQRRPVQST